MRITEANLDEYGTVSVARTGEKIVSGTIVSLTTVVSPYSGDDPQYVTVQLNSGSTIELVDVALDFTPVRPTLDVGWYSDEEYPVRKGWAPVLVSTKGAFYGNTDTPFMGDTRRLVPLTTEARDA